MTLAEILTAGYAWADGHARDVLLGATLVPVVGTILAAIGKRGRTDQDGRMIASLVVGLGILGVVLEALALVACHALLGHSPLEANVLLLVAPVVCLAGCLVGVRWVFPLSELGSVRTAADLGAFVLVCLGVLWLFSRFYWGVLFGGSLAQLALILFVLALVVRRLYRRALRRGEAPVGDPGLPI